MSFSVQYNRCEAEALCNCIGDVEPAERGHHREYPVPWRGWASAGLRRWRRVVVLTDPNVAKDTEPSGGSSRSRGPTDFGAALAGTFGQIGWIRVVANREARAYERPGTKPAPFQENADVRRSYPDRRVFAWQPCVTGARSRASALCRAASGAKGPWTERLR